MKNKKPAILMFALIAGLFAFNNFEGGSIKGRVIPSDGASEVWAMSSTDTLKAQISQGAFEITDAKAGTYRLMIDAKEPFKDVVRDGIIVSEGGVIDLGEIQLEK